jgi:hypothetical protein
MRSRHRMPAALGARARAGAVCWDNYAEQYAIHPATRPRQKCNEQAERSGSAAGVAAR